MVRRTGISTTGGVVRCGVRENGIDRAGRAVHAGDSARTARRRGGARPRAGAAGDGAGDDRHRHPRARDRGVRVVPRVVRGRRRHASRAVPRGPVLHGRARGAAARIPDEPASFPDNFPDEAFWWAGETTLTYPGGSALLRRSARRRRSPTAPSRRRPGRVRAHPDPRDRPRAERLVPLHVPVRPDRPAGRRQGAARRELHSDVGCTAPPCDDGVSRLGDSVVGPDFLQWDTTQSAPPEGYVGNPAVAHRVTGSRFVPEGETRAGELLPHPADHRPGRSGRPARRADRLLPRSRASSPGRPRALRRRAAAVRRPRGRHERRARGHDPQHRLGRARARQRRASRGRRGRLLGRGRRLRAARARSPRARRAPCASGSSRPRRRERTARARARRGRPADEHHAPHRGSPTAATRASPRLRDRSPRRRRPAAPAAPPAPAPAALVPAAGTVVVLGRPRARRGRPSAASRSRRGSPAPGSAPTACASSCGSPARRTSSACASTGCGRAARRRSSPRPSARRRATRSACGSSARALRRRLTPGRYRIEIAAGTSRTTLGAVATRRSASRDEAPAGRRPPRRRPAAPRRVLTPAAEPGARHAGPITGFSSNT